MELTYRKEGDYLVPNLTVPPRLPGSLGKYAFLRRNYLKQHHRIQYLSLLTSGELNDHLWDIEQTACARVEIITTTIAASEGVTEELKATDPMKWVALMNNIRSAAEEAIMEEIIYT